MRLALFSLAFAIGCIVPWLLPWLLPFWALLPLALVLLAVTRGVERGVIILFLVGFGYGLYAANQTSLHQLPDYPHGLDALVEGRVIGLADYQKNRTRFLFQVDSFEVLNNEPIGHAPRRIRLSWYYPDSIETGDSFKFELRLRRPRGLVNPSQFDYRQWLLSEGIDATGYVRRSLGKVSSDNGSIFNKWREEQRARLQQTGFPHENLIAALGIGDRSGIDADQWQLFAGSGIIHLMVISGLHLGFASFLGFWCGSLILRPLTLLNPRWKVQDFGWFSAMLVALLYALCAGLSTPTLRAFIMISTLAVTRLRGLRVSIWTTLALAFAFTLLLQPLSVLSAGLWMSFGAVAVLVAAFQGRAKESKLVSLLRAQIVLFVGFSALPLAFGNPVPLVAPFVNLVAVPLIGVLVVPLVLLGLAAGSLSLELQLGVWRWADVLIGLFQGALVWVHSFDLPQVHPPDLGLWAYLFMGSCAFALVAVPVRARIWPLLLLGLSPLYMTRPDSNFLSLHLFDVGQGTAVLIQQDDYALLYDTGPTFSQSFDAGRDILLPRLAGVNASNRDLIVSHGDSDHAGGAAAILESDWVNGEIFVGEALGLDSRETFCTSSTQWYIDSVEYRFIHPEQDSVFSNNNDQSCVLLIRFANRQILLPGDISSSVENFLLEELSSPIDLLLVPHHGSATSSSQQFVSQVQPKLALVSSGYGNSFGHPVEEVVQRYLDIGSRVLNTADTGAISVQWKDSMAEPEISLARDAFGLWWQE